MILKFSFSFYSFMKNYATLACSDSLSRQINVIQCLVYRKIRSRAGNYRSAQSHTLKNLFSSLTLHQGERTLGGSAASAKLRWSLERRKVLTAKRGPVPFRPRACYCHLLERCLAETLSSFAW